MHQLKVQEILYLKLFGWHKCLNRFTLEAHSISWKLMVHLRALPHPRPVFLLQDQMMDIPHKEVHTPAFRQEYKNSGFSQTQLLSTNLQVSPLSGNIIRLRLQGVILIWFWYGEDASTPSNHKGKTRVSPIVCLVWLGAHKHPSR